MPLVFFDRVCLTDRFSSVVADGAQSAQAATQHLLDSGSKRIAFIGGANHLYIVKQRKHGYLEALRANKIPIEKELVECRRIDYNEGMRATEALLALPNPPDAILAMNDTLAFAAMEVDERHANYVEPKLSSVCHQTYKMGETACRLLIDQLRGDRTVRQVVIPTSLQIRESSMKKKITIHNWMKTIKKEGNTKHYGTKSANTGKEDTVNKGRSVETDEGT